MMQMKYTHTEFTNNMKKRSDEEYKDRHFRWRELNGWMVGGREEAMKPNRFLWREYKRVHVNSKMVWYWNKAMKMLGPFCFAFFALLHRVHFWIDSKSLLCIEIIQQQNTQAKWWKKEMRSEYPWRGCFANEKNISVHRFYTPVLSRTHSYVPLPTFIARATQHLMYTPIGQFAMS